MSNRDRGAEGVLACVAAAWLLGSFVAFAPVALAETKLVSSEVSVSGTGIFMNGDDDQFRQRHGLPPDFTGGIENLRMEWSWGKGGTAVLDGRGMFDSGDYLARLKLEQSGKGYINAGYRQFRTWYDGTGGWSPPTDTIIHYFDEDLRLDRGEGWFEAGLRMPEIPEVTVRYSHLSRDGNKNALQWGDTVPAAGVTRSIVPALWNIDEDRDIVNLDVRHRLLGSTVGAGFVYEGSDIDNALDVRRRPGEAADRYLTQENRVSSDVLGTHTFVTKPLMDRKIVISTSYGYTHLDTDLGGSRIYGNEFHSAFNPTYTGRQPLDEGFLELDGSTDLKQHVGTLSLQTQLTKHVQATAGGRVEKEDTDGSSDFTETSVPFFPPTAPVTEQPLAADSDTGMTAYTGDLELRYTGIKNWVWTIFGEWDDRDAEIDETELDTAAPAVLLERSTDMKRFGQKYGVGAVWYPLKRVNLSSRYTYRFNDYDYDHHTDSTDNTTASTDRLPAYITSQKIKANIVDVRLTYRVLDNLRLTTRYDGTFSEFTQDSDGLDSVDSGDVNTNAFGGGATWNPTPGSYLQSDVSYVLSRTKTLASDLSGAADGLLEEDFENDYWTASVTGGLALTEALDLRGQYFFYYASNFDEDLASTTQPYGADATEHGASLQLGYRVSEQLRLRTGVAYFTNDEATTGGANDYDATIVTGGVDMKF